MGSPLRGCPRIHDPALLRGAPGPPWLSSSSPPIQSPRPGESSRAHCLGPGSDTHWLPASSLSLSCPSSPEGSLSLSQLTNKRAGSPCQPGGGRRTPRDPGPGSPSFLTSPLVLPQTKASQLCPEWEAAPSSEPGSSLLSQPERSIQQRGHLPKNEMKELSF